MTRLEYSRHPANVCGGKTAYETRELARSAVERVRERYGKKRAYHCPYCGDWHIGRAEGQPFTKWR